MAEINTHAGNVRLVGGRLCLDFTNTVNCHTLPQPKEYLVDYAALVAWGRHASMVDDQQGKELLTEAARRPLDAAVVLNQARRLRLALYHMFTRLPALQQIAPEDLITLSEALSQAPRQLKLFQTGTRLTWGLGHDGDPLKRMIWPIAWSAAELLSSPEATRVRECAGEGCSWLFLDTSRNGSRRWCSMEDCGNRAKARRHYAQHKDSSANNA